MLSRQRKMYLVLLAAAGLALLVDKTLLRPAGPAAADAAVSADGPAPASAPAAPESPELAAESLRGLASLAQQLFTSPGFADQATPARDLFQPTDAYRDTIAEQPDALAAQTPDEPDPPVLAGLAAGPNGACVLADGQLLYPGESIGPWRLVEIRQYGAVFARGDLRMVVLCAGYEGSDAAEAAARPKKSVKTTKAPPAPRR